MVQRLEGMRMRATLLRNRTLCHTSAFCQLTASGYLTSPKCNTAEWEQSVRGGMAEGSTTGGAEGSTSRELMKEAMMELLNEVPALKALIDKVTVRLTQPGRRKEALVS